MYNKEVKLQYIDDCLLNSTTKNPELIRKKNIVFFNKTGKLEKEFGIDIAQADYETLISMLGRLCRGSVAYQRVVLSNIKKYIDWCLLNGKTYNKENLLDNTTVENLDFYKSYRDSMVVDEQQLLDYLNTFAELSKENISIIYRTCILLIWNGFNTDEIINLKLSQFNKKDHLIKTDNKCIEISAACFEHLNMLLDIDVWHVRTGFATRNYEKIKSDFLIETTYKNRKNFKIYLYQFISNGNQSYREKTKSKMFLNTTNILKSGIFYRMFQNELNNSKIDSTEFINNFGNGKNINQIAITNMTIEYENWKKAFDL